MSDAYRFVVIFTTPEGRVTHGLTNDPTRLLAMRVTEGSMSAKQAAASDVYAITPVTTDKGALEAAIAFHRLVVVAMSNPDPIRKAILIGEAYAAPWPFREERDESPDET